MADLPMMPAGPTPATVSKPVRRWVVLAVMCSGLLLVAMDNTILNVALPAIADDLHPSKTGLLWITDLYSLVVAGLLVTAGTIGDRFGRRRLFLLGLVLFGLASIVAAAAGSVPVLLASRVLRAVGGAMIMPATLSIIRHVFLDARERGTAIGVWAATGAAGAAIGPILAGATLTWFPWGSVFLISLPIIVAALVLALLYVPESQDSSPGRFDGISALLSMVALIGLVFAIKQIASHGLFDPWGLTALVLGAALAVVFARRQMQLSDPLLDLSLFSSRTFTAATLSVLMSFFGFFSVLYFLTQYLQIIRGQTPLQTGLWMLPMAAASFVVSPSAGAIIGRAGTRWTLTGSFTVIAGSLALFSMLGKGADTLILMLGLTGVGLGANLVATAGSQAIMSSASPERAGAAAGIQETAFETGGGLGIAVLGSVMTAVYGAALTLPTGLPNATIIAAQESLPAATTAAATLTAPQGAHLEAAAASAFIHGLSAAALTGAGLMLITACACAIYLPARQEQSTSRKGELVE